MMTPSSWLRMAATGAAFSLSLPGSAAGAPLKLRCSWMPSDRNFAGDLLTGDIAALAKAFGEGQPLRMTIEIEQQRIEILSEIDNDALGYGSLAALDNEIRVTFEPKVLNTSLRFARVLITIDRFDLSSTMILSTREQPKPMAARWIRHGACQVQKF